LDPTHHVVAEEFQQLAQDPNALLFDIREPTEFERGHIPGARLMPLRTVLDRGPDLPKDRPLLLACRSGRRTQRAMHMLQTMGFDDVYGLRGGILAWQAEGFPVSVEQPARTDSPRS
jgi:SulP family sulfate permease